jgi:hypothetical protein
MYSIRNMLIYFYMVKNNKKKKQLDGTHDSDSIHGLYRVEDGDIFR